MPNFTQSEFDKLSQDDLLKNVFVLDSNGKVCMRVLMIGQNIINWWQIGWLLADQDDLQAILDTIASDITDLENNKINSVLINAANGVAWLDGTGKIPALLLPSFVDDVLEYANFAAFPVTGETSKIYVALDTNKVYRWSGSVYTEISASPGSTDAVPEWSVNKYFTEGRVLSTLLAGLSLASSAVISAADSALSAFGKLQAQISLRALLTWNTFTGNQVINGANTLSVSSWGGSTPDAIDVGAGWLKIWQINGDAVIRSGFAAKFFKFRNSSSVDKLTIEYDTWNVNSQWSWSWGWANTASGQMEKINGLDHVFYSWFVNNVRRAYMGFAWAWMQILSIVNEFTNADINFVTNGTGKLTHNGNPIAPPTGALMAWATGTAPSGYLLCDGTAVSRTTYASLFWVISTTYGVWDGSTTFNLPNLKWRVIVWQDVWQTEFDVLWETWGAKTHTLQANEMPVHRHNVPHEASNAAANGSLLSHGTIANPNGAKDTSDTGGGQSHNNLQPYIVLNYIIKT